jgi:hypothetical protein
LLRRTSENSWSAIHEPAWKLGSWRASGGEARSREPRSGLGGVPARAMVLRLLVLAIARDSGQTDLRAGAYFRAGRRRRDSEPTASARGPVIGGCRRAARCGRRGEGSERVLLEVVVVETLVLVEGLLYLRRHFGHRLGPQVHPAAAVVPSAEDVLPPRFRLLGEVLAVVGAARLLSEQGLRVKGMRFRDAHP